MRGHIDGQGENEHIPRGGPVKVVFTSEDVPSRYTPECREGGRGPGRYSSIWVHAERDG
jgi:hypothetical protein